MTSEAKALRVPEAEFRPMGRNARGVRAMSLSKGDSIISCDVVADESEILILSERGFGKRTDFGEFTAHHRATGGVRAMNVTWDGGGAVRQRRDFAISQNFPLHEERFTDDWFTLNYVGRALPNTWGLYDMHGNAAEWTRTAYRPYPYAEDGRNDPNAGGRKVARGGSFNSRPRDATSSFRVAYQPWQKVFDVGFRVVIEEE